MIPSPKSALEAIKEGTGKGVLVAVLDTGIEQTHPHFESRRFLQSHEVHPNQSGFTVRECEPTDHVGHGTGVAGIIHHLAPDCTLVSIKVLDAELSRNRHESIACGVQKALAMSARILNCSFGVPGVHFTLPHYKAWTDQAFLADCHVVTASSNRDPHLAEWPSHLASTHSVRYEDLDEETWNFLEAQPVSFAAKGVDARVPMPGGGYTELTGSSFAAAHLSGLLARLLSAFPHLSPSMARELLRRLAGS